MVNEYYGEKHAPRSNRRKLMNKKALISGIALLILMLVIGGTIAYFTSKDTNAGDYKFGEVKIELSEPNWDPEDDHVVKSNAEFDKDPQVTNKGTADSYVRIKVKVTDLEVLQELLEADAPKDIEKLWSASVGSDWELSGDPEVKEDEATFTYVYTNVLPAGETTAPLFEKVVFPDGLEPAKVQEIGDNFLISVTADGVQTATFGGPKDAFEAFDDQGN